MDLHEISADSLRRAVREGTPHMIRHADGRIFAANSAMCEMLGSSEYQLKQLDWRDLVPKGIEREADQEMSADMQAGQVDQYQLPMSLLGKHGIPIHGDLLALRWPPAGDYQYCHCWFSPYVDGSRATLSLITEYVSGHTLSTQELVGAIKTMTAYVEGQINRPVSQRLWDTAGEWIAANPKLAAVVLVVVLALNPFPIVASYLTRIGWLPATPVRLEVQEPDGSTVRINTPDEWRTVSHQLTPSSQL